MHDERVDRRALPRRRVFLGAGLRFGEAEAIDVCADGVGLIVERAPRFGEILTVGAHEAVVRHVGRLRGRVRVGLMWVQEPAREEPSFACPDALPAFAVVASPYFANERLPLRVARVSAHGLTFAAPAALPRGHVVKLDLHLPCVGVEPARARIVGRDRAEWVDQPRGLARYLLAGEPRLTPAALRHAGLDVGSVLDVVGFDFAQPQDLDEILALRLRAHQAERHLEHATPEDLRSPYDAHSRHVICRLGQRIVGYVRVIFVDRAASRSQYVAMGGHEVPQWLWDAGFVEAGAGAIDPDFQRAGLFGPLMGHATRVARESGHRFMLGACDDSLLEMYASMGFEPLETRVVEPKPGWRFRSHLIYLDAQRSTALAA